MSRYLRNKEKTQERELKNKNEKTAQILRRLTKLKSIYLYIEIKFSF